MTYHLPNIYFYNFLLNKEVFFLQFQLLILVDDLKTQCHFVLREIQKHKVYFVFNGKQYYVKYSILAIIQFFLP